MALVYEPFKHIQPTCQSSEREAALARRRVRVAEVWETAREALDVSERARFVGEASPAWATKKQKQEAPYLTHLVRHHGQLTLTQPDNLGARRQPGVQDVPTASTSSLSLDSLDGGAGGAGRDEGKEAPKKMKKKKKKKKVQPDADIVEAVMNAGRTPSPAATPLESASNDVGGGGEPPDPLDSHASLLSDALMSPPPAYPATSPSRTPSPDREFHTPTLSGTSDDVHEHPSVEPLPLVLPPAAPIPALLMPEPQSEVVEDPFVIAWEKDRADGLSLEVRIARDLERRTSQRPLTDEPAEVEGGLPEEAGEDEEDQEAIERRTREIREAEAAQDIPRVARALSMRAGRKFADAAERRRGRVFRESTLITPLEVPDLKEEDPVASTSSTVVEEERSRTEEILEGDGKAKEEEAEGSEAEGDEEEAPARKDLLLVGEVLGSAVPTGCTTEEIESLPFAPVNLDRRRIDKQGRVKQKLSVVGVRCIDCTICLARLKVNELAVALPKCLHVSHAKCAQTWLRQNRQCPVCREEVFDRPNIEI
ncbi:hypothetical protein MNV49_007324 [Pseudohyphozyma bogoriensis]|nr:hypothetical protein MNV49_007324 [Pseudohyphozyma bogoriensis]